MPGPGDICPHEIIVLERPAADGPFGAKGLGEMSANPPIPAVANAVFDAVGVRIDTLPITPEKDLARAEGAGRRRPRARRGSAMAVRQKIVGIGSPRGAREALRAAYYLADDELATAVYLALALGKPLLLEGAPGVGKTEAAKAIAGVLGRALIRLQCYEGSTPRRRSTNGITRASCWRSARRAPRRTIDIYPTSFLIERPLLRALRRPEETRAADRRDRPLRPRVRGVPARIPVRFPDHDPRARHDPRRRAAGRRS